MSSEFAPLPEEPGAGIDGPEPLHPDFGFIQKGFFLRAMADPGDRVETPAFTFVQGQQVLQVEIDIPGGKPQIRFFLLPGYREKPVHFHPDFQFFSEMIKAADVDSGRLVFHMSDRSQIDAENGLCLKRLDSTNSPQQQEQPSGMYLFHVAKRAGSPAQSNDLSEQGG